METHFASPIRSGEDELHRQIHSAANNPLIDGIMCMAGGLIAVLNENRQILAVNHRLLEAMGVDDPQEVLGLRPGEALGCCYAYENVAGCGTSLYCITCGAAISIVSSLESEKPVERMCCLKVKREGRYVDIYFLVHACSIKIGPERFVLIFLNDITRQQYQASLERVFFHDINNTIMGLLNASELLCGASPEEADEMAAHIASLAKRLSREVDLQRYLSGGNTGEMDIQGEIIEIEALISEVKLVVSNHPVSQGKPFQANNLAKGVKLETDLSLLMRVLKNMLINAFEASHSEHAVRLDVFSTANKVIFCVWNSKTISPSIQHRIFQRNFSTKKELGHGLGTYSMKLIGEQLLDGHVYFKTTPEDGTRFFLELPIHRFPRQLSM